PAGRVAGGAAGRGSPPPHRRGPRGRPIVGPQPRRGSRQPQPPVGVPVAGRRRRPVRGARAGNRRDLRWVRELPGPVQPDRLQPVRQRLDLADPDPGQTRALHATQQRLAPARRRTAPARPRPVGARLLHRAPVAPGRQVEPRRLRHAQLMIRLGSLAGYSFEGPWLLGGWTPPDQPGLFAVLYKPEPDTKPDTYAVIYVGHSDKLVGEGFPWKHPAA